MAKGHRSQIKRESNENNRETRPSATLSFARIPEQKACFVMDAIRGKDVTTALAILQYNPRYASEVTYKLLKSAVANAENNNGMNPDNLYVAECYANNGPIMKRIQPRAQGRAYRILKRMCHLTVILDEKNKTEDAETKDDTKAADKKASSAKPEKKATAAKKTTTAAKKKTAAKKTTTAAKKTDGAEKKTAAKKTTTAAKKTTAAKSTTAKKTTTAKKASDTSEKSE